MRKIISAAIICISTGFIFTPGLRAEDQTDCASLLIFDLRVSVEGGQDFGKVSHIAKFESAQGLPSAATLGPELIGRRVQVEVLDGRRVFVRGEILGSGDAWESFDLREEATGLILKIRAELPELGLRRVELLDPGIPAAMFDSAVDLEAFEEKFEKEARDLGIHKRRAGIEAKMAWYRKWNGRNMRTTLYDRQYKMAHLHYLLSLNKIDEALALLRLDIDNTKVPAVAIHKALEERRDLRNLKSSDPAEQKRIADLDARIENRLREQGQVLGVHYGEFRAIVRKLQQVIANEKGLYAEQMVAAAKTVYAEIIIVNPSAKLMPTLLNLRKEPDVKYVQTAFFAQPYSLIKKLEKDLWAERVTFTWMVFNKVSGQDFLRRSVDAVTTVLPAWARSPLNALRKNKRDMDARRFDLPQIERIAQLDGGPAAQVEELRKLYYGDPQSTLLKNFSRLADREEQQVWLDLMSAAPADFQALMQQEEKTALEWGELSKHYHQNEMNMTAAVITAGGVGSGFLYYKFGSPDSWLWKAMDSMVQLLSFAN